jgi:uncharacterized membrane protein
VTTAATQVHPVPVLLRAARPVAVVLTGILAGAVVAAWLTDAAVGGSAELWIGYHQAVTTAYTLLLPPVGALALVAALAAVVVCRHRRRDRRLVAGAVGCLLAGLLVTVVVHFPMNSEIATWQAARPPVDWQQVRDRWLTGHAVRATLAVAAFALLALSRAPSPTSERRC